MAALIRDIAEAICFVERHQHLDPNRRTRAERPCATSLNIGARVFGVMRARATAPPPVPPPTLGLEREVQDFGGWLRAQLKAQHMSQRSLARLAGVDHGTVSRLARSKRAPLLATARKLEEALGLYGAEA